MGNHMEINEYEEIESALNRIKRISKIVQILLKVALICFTLFLAFLLAAIMFSLLLPASLPEDITVNVSSLLFLVVFGAVTWLLIKIILDIFGDVVNGKSPFTMQQVKRFRLVAALFLVSAIIEAVTSIGVMPIISAGSMGINYVTSPSLASSMTINAGNLFCAMIFWALSLVFKYGVPLQRFSDETL